MASHSGRSISVFFAKAIALACPFIFVVASYVAWDPFMVLRAHSFGNYYDVAAPVEVNRDYVSLEIFEAQNVAQRYDSFIFGSSRSFPFHCDDWQPYIGGGKPFHYPAASENLYGIRAKLRYLDERGVSLSHVLFEVVDAALAGVTPRTDHLHRLPRRITGESWLEFQETFVAAYFTEFFFAKYIQYKVTGRVPTHAVSALGVHAGDFRIDPFTNDFFFEARERELAADPVAYYRRRADDFPVLGAPPPCADPVLSAQSRTYLREIRDLFAKHGTQYRVLISSVYGGACLDRGDLSGLREIFGEKSVLDLSGSNDLSNEATNFYDSTHLRPEAARRVLSALYQ